MLRPLLMTVRLLIFIPLLLQGCTSASLTGASHATGAQMPVTVGKSEPSEPALTSAELSPFLGNWDGTLTVVYADKALSTTSETRRALLVVKLLSEKPMVTWALGAGNGEGTWRDSGTYKPPSLGRYPARFGKTNGVVFMEFTTRFGNTFRFFVKESRLIGEHTSAGVSAHCSLTPSSQEEPFTDAALRRFEVTFN